MTCGYRDKLKFHISSHLSDKSDHPSNAISENSVWLFDLSDCLAFEKWREYVAILSWGIVLTPTGGIS